MDEWDYEYQLTQLELFASWYEKQAYKGPKIKMAKEDAHMVAGFNYILKEVRKHHEEIPFSYDWGPHLENDIDYVLSQEFLHRYKKEEKNPKIKCKKDWLYEAIPRCANILIAILNGHGHLYGIYWDAYEIEK